MNNPRLYTRVIFLLLTYNFNTYLHTRHILSLCNACIDIEHRRGEEKTAICGRAALRFTVRACVAGADADVLCVQAQKSSWRVYIKSVRYFRWWGRKRSILKEETINLAIKMGEIILLGRATEVCDKHLRQGDDGLQVFSVEWSTKIFNDRSYKRRLKLHGSVVNNDFSWKLNNCLLLQGY